MDRRSFEGLKVLRRAHAANAGNAEVCRGRDGMDLIRLRVREDACQRACLGERAPACVRLERGVLEILYPFRDGASLEEWLFAEGPGLGARRDACLSLLTQCVEDRAPACVLFLSARGENLRFTPRGVRLLYLADWGAWRSGISPADAVEAAAELCREILTRGIPAAAPLPVELRLILRRTQAGDYDGWGKLQRDVAALPDDLPTLDEAGRKLLLELWRRTERLRKPVFCLVTAAALALALLSLTAEGARRRDERAALWPGMTAAAGQEWGEIP